MSNVEVPWRVTLTNYGLPNNVTTVPISNGGSYIGTTTWSTNSSGYSISPTITVQNDPSSLDVKGKIIHNGRDLEERLSTIEKILHIPERDVMLEEKYPKLKKLYDQYIKELSKARMWESLKGEAE